MSLGLGNKKYIQNYGGSLNENPRMRHSRRWDDLIKTEIGETGRDDVDSNVLAQKGV
jgi:hypothetical protein